MEVNLALMLFSPLPNLLPLILVINHFFLEGETALWGTHGG